MCPKISTDDLMLGVYNFLHLDLFQHVEVMPQPNIASIRNFEYEIPKYARPYNVKCKQQLATWLKRYRFRDDIYTDAELEDLTNKKFLDDQLRIGTFVPLKYRTFLVVQEARRLIKSVLGTFREEDIYEFCSFSLNGTVGYGGKNVYLDKKIYPGSTLTGTKAECEWFTDYLQGDALLSSCLMKDGKLSFNIVDSLKQVNVPKTAKILRPVRPNTLIGSFRSIGIGKLVTKLIKERLSINLNYLQERHRRLAHKASRSLSLVTADLSSASDSFTSALLNRLLPRSWYTALRLGRTPYVEVGGRVIWSPSFMAMGIGFTFPVMTLCFFALIRAIQKLSRTYGTVSVFGDDLIYPMHIHHFVVGVLNDLGFRLNLDKTFTLVPFRESCGGDYYEGVDVRPARPEGVYELLEGDAISAYVYKLFNSLIRRWEVEELPSTLGFLLNVLRTNGLPIYRVPSDFPDTSGIKDGTWRQFAVAEKPSSNRRRPYYSGVLVSCLQDRSTLRPVGHMGIYLWNALRCVPEESSSPYVASRESLVWRAQRGPRARSTLQTGRSYRKLVAFTTKRGTRFYQPASTPYNR